jgi:hypothetical protein
MARVRLRDTFRIPAEFATLFEQVVRRAVVIDVPGGGRGQHPADGIEHAFGHGLLEELCGAGELRLDVDRNGHLVERALTGGRTTPRRSRSAPPSAIALTRSS